MRVIAYYDAMTFPVVRRLIGPLSVLSQRGHQCFFQHISDLRQIDTAGYHLIFLPDAQVRLGTRLPDLQGLYVYDLSDPTLLKKDECVEVIRQCHAVTVPNETMAAIVKPFCGRVKVIPSLVHAETFLRARPIPFQRPIIACVGDHDWNLIAEPLKDALKQLPSNVTVATDSRFLAEFLGKRAILYPIDLQTYPALCRSSFLALLPRDKSDRDTVWAYEFGLCGVPAIASPAYRDVIVHKETGMIANVSHQWIEYLTALVTKERARSMLSAGAVAEAREKSATRQADHWLHSIKRLLP